MNVVNAEPGRAGRRAPRRGGEHHSSAGGLSAGPQNGLYTIGLSCAGRREEAANGAPSRSAFTRGCSRGGGAALSVRLASRADRVMVPLHGVRFVGGGRAILNRRAKDAWERSIRAHDHTGAIELALQDPKCRRPFTCAGLPERTDPFIERERRCGPHIDHTPPRIDGGFITRAAQRLGTRRNAIC